MVILVLLLLMETALAADVFLNSDWEKVMDIDRDLFFFFSAKQHVLFCHKLLFSSVRIYLRIQQGGLMISKIS